MRSNVFKLTLHDLRRPLALWGLALAAFAFTMAAVYPTVVRFPDLAAEVDHALSHYRVFTGLSDRATSPAGFFNFTSFTSILPLAFGLFAALYGNSITAIHWTDGSLELLMARPLPRWRLLLEKYGGLAAALALLAALVWAVFVWRSRALQISIDAGRLAQASAGLALLGFCFGSLAMLLGILFRRRRNSLAVSLGAVLLSAAFYLAPGLGEGLAFLRYFSPFYYAAGASPLAIGLQTGQALVLLGLTAAFLGGALWAFDRADL